MKLITAMLTDFGANIANKTQRKQVTTLLMTGFPCQVGLRYQPNVDYLSILLDLAEHHKKPMGTQIITRIPSTVVSILSGVAPHMWKPDPEHSLELRLHDNINILPEEARKSVEEMRTRVSSHIQRLLGGRRELLPDVAPLGDYSKPQKVDINLVARRLLENFSVSDSTAANVLSRL
jgi:hypothetical protein